jgi:hypothetical protein
LGVCVGAQHHCDRAEPYGGYGGHHTDQVRADQLQVMTIRCRRPLRRATAPEAPLLRGASFLPPHTHLLREAPFCDQSHERHGANVRPSVDDLTIAQLATDGRLVAGMGFSVSP